MTTEDTLAFYAEPGPHTAAGPHRDALAALPSDVSDLLEAVRGLLAHEPGLPLETGAPVPVPRPSGHLRPVERILDRVLERDARPLTEPRDPNARVTGCCRHFTLLTVAALRAHGVPARARCGFARYFTPGLHGDHWVAEHWDRTEARWVLADAQLGPDLLRDLDIAFDPADIPRTDFVVAGQAWTGCRSGEIDPAACGLEGEGQNGWWWIAGNLVRDIAALAKTELLPWDMWGAMPGPGEPVPDDLARTFDRLAAITADPETAAEARAHYASEALRAPGSVYNALLRTHEPVTA